MPHRLLAPSLLVLSLLSAHAFNVQAGDSPVGTITPAAPAVTAAAPVAPASIAKVNGVAIPGEFAEFILQNRRARGLPHNTLTRESIRESLVIQELLVQEALSNGLDKEASVASALEFQRRDLLGKAALENWLRAHPVTDDAVRAEYERAKNEAGNEEYRARHILVNSEKEALDLLAQLQKRKARFDALAKKYSKDSTASNGGDLGWSLPANLVPEFARAMTALKKGQTYATPVQTQFGWHILRLDDTRKLDFPSFEDIKERIAGKLQQSAIRKHVQDLTATAKVE